MTAFDDDAAIAIVQARHEALLRRAGEIAPTHLLLGILNTLRPAAAASLFMPGALDLLRTRLAGGRHPAPPLAQEVGYAMQSARILDEARALAEPAPATPLHLLLAMHACGDSAPELQSLRDELRRAGLGRGLLERHLALPGGPGPG